MLSAARSYRGDLECVGSGFRVQGLGSGFRVYRVWGLGLRLGFRVQGFGFRGPSRREAERFAFFSRFPPRTNLNEQRVLKCRIYSRYYNWWPRGLSK